MHRMRRRRRSSVMLLLVMLVAIWISLLLFSAFQRDKPKPNASHQTQEKGFLPEEEHLLTADTEPTPPMLEEKALPPGRILKDASQGAFRVNHSSPLTSPHSTPITQGSMLEQLLALGYKRGTAFDLDQRHTWHPPGGDCPEASVGVPPSSGTKPYAPIAYLTCISNEEFVDGALVLGVSLRQTSVFLQKGLADLVILATAKRVGAASRKRLLAEGTYDHLFEVPSLAYRVDKNGIFRDTFDKIYMFNLTMYEKIVFMDADMVAVRSMDKLFSKPSLTDPGHLGAIGSKMYFQTGMIVYIPTRAMFDCIYTRFIRGTPPDGKEFIGSSARDGSLLRRVFGTAFTSISNRYSRNLNPRFAPESVRAGEDAIIAIHLRGKVKPWFDKRAPNHMPDLGKKEYGFTHLRWWSLYETAVHKNGAYYQKALSDAHTPGAAPVVIDGIPFGGDASLTHALGDLSPLTHVWMQRNSSSAYVQLLSEEDSRRRNRTLPTLHKIPSPRFGLSCAEVCAEVGRQCSNEALYFSSLNDCAELKRVFGCKTCELGVYWRPHPGNDFPAAEEMTGEKSTRGLVCRYNYLNDERGLPNCTASYPTTKRYCPCVLL